MRLKRLKMSGFKSFGDEMDLVFGGTGITVVVGPNGCGKSNVVDAIRWVLGEQSPRYLRGSTMGDVIFNGSENRKPLGRAEVTISFDNSESTALEKYKDYAEISVTRRLYRSGESEYLINKAPCRLMDIRELVMDTGVAGRSYAVVEQGRVEEFVLSSPSERRIFMEEAAGIVRYKSKRMAAEKKLEQTQTNLLRVQDLLGELNRQEGALREQMERAKEYLSLREEVKLLTGQLAGARFAKSRRACTEMETKLQTLGVEIEGAETLMATYQAKFEKFNIELTSLELGLKDNREAAHALEGEIHETETQLALEKQSQVNNSQWMEGHKKTLEECEKKRITLAEEQEKIAGETKTLEAQVEEMAQEIGAAEEATEASRVEKETLETQNKVRNDQLMECHTQLNGLANQRQYATQMLEEGVKRKKGIDLQMEENTQALASQKKMGEELEARLAGLEQSHIQKTGQRQTLETHLTELETARKEKNLALKKREREELETRSRLESLREIQASGEGFDESVRKALSWARENPMEAESVDWMGPLAGFIQVPDDVAQWAGHFLAPHLETIVVGTESGVESLEKLWPSRGIAGVKVVSLEGHAGLQASAHSLATRVRLPENFSGLGIRLFGQVHLIEGETLPLPLPDPGKEGKEWLTGDGLVHISPRKQVTLGAAASPAAGMLRRKAEISSLEEKLDQDQATLAALKTEMEAQDLSFLSTQSELETLKEAENHALLEKTKATSERDHAGREIGRLEQVAEGLRKERGTLEFEEVNMTEGLKKGEGQKKEWEEKKLTLEAENQDVTEKTASAQERLETLNQTLMEKKLKGERLSAQTTALETRAGLAEEEAGTLEEKTATTTQELASFQEKLSGSGFQIQTSSAALAEQQLALAAKRSALVEKSTEFEKQEQDKKRLDLQNAEQQKNIEKIRAKIHEVEVALSSERTRKEQWADQLPEGAQVTLTDFDEKAVEKTLHQAQVKMNRIEGVNLGAPEEYEALMTRMDFLSVQKEDLELALSDLEESIRRMNTESRRRFKETFDLVNTKFQELFPKVFNGGSAHLVLTNAEDLLLAGVDIVAQPPGKKTQSLALLSGGEKALTAIALIFSFFLIKPSPFCLLDEVDAPLDEVNVGRFSGLIQSMTDHSQFIIITHNKRTMEIGDTLYGVTMEEPGISKVVSVNMN